MSLFEWLGESFNPGPVGTVDVGGRSRRSRPRILVLICFGLSILLLGGWTFLVLGVLEVRDTTAEIGVLVGTVVYLLLGYAVHPRPDTSNLGWLGGLIDHPFRYSDDINRFLLTLRIVLWPGRFISESLVDMVGLVVYECKGQRKG